MAGLAPAAEVRIDHEFEGELDVFGGKRRAVMPLHAIAQLDLPMKAVSRDAAVFDRRDFGCKRRGKFALWRDSKERIENTEMDALIDFDVDQMRIEDGRFLREADDKLAGRLGGRCRESFAATEDIGHDQPGGAERHHGQRTAAGWFQEDGVVCIGHDRSPFCW